VTIEKDQPWVFGKYSCFAKNQHGHDTETVYLKQARKYIFRYYMA